MADPDLLFLYGAPFVRSNMAEFSAVILHADYTVPHCAGSSGHLLRLAATNWKDGAVLHLSGPAPVLARLRAEAMSGRVFIDQSLFKEN